jgi:hypothetical protein
MRRPSAVLWWLVGFAASCNFDEAFRRYCEGNPSCPRADASAGPEAGPEAEPETTPDTAVVPDTSFGPPEVGPGRDAWGDGLLPFPSPPKSCRQSRDCEPNEVCHPFGGVCMRQCNTIDDCPPYLDTCAEITDRNGVSVGAPKVCQCGSALNCMSYGNFTCHPADNLCERLCEKPQDCQMFEPQRFCDPVIGLCQRTPDTCAGNRDCPPTLPRCDQASHRCTGCIDSSDCANRPDGLTQCSSSGACVPP